jgi:hypothetical protein
LSNNVGAFPEIHQKESTCRANIEHSQNPAIQTLQKHIILVQNFDGYLVTKNTLIILYYIILYYTLKLGLGYTRGG